MIELAKGTDLKLVIDALEVLTGGKMKAKEFKESQYNFILSQCATDEQRCSLALIRDLCKTNLLREYSDTRYVFYDGVKAVEVALIRLEQSKSNPEIIIKLPSITEYRNISLTRSKRYGFEIQPDGKPINLGTVYQVQDRTREKPCLLQSVAEIILDREVSPDNFEQLMELIKFMIETYEN